MLARGLVAVLGAGFLVAFAPSLSTAAPTYPIITCHVVIDPASGVVKAGGTFTVSGSSSVSQPWQVTFNGQTHSFTGKTFTTTLQVPKTAANETLTLQVTCSNGKSLFSIKILGSGTGGGHLPNTGGPSVWWLILAALAGISGSALMWRSRHRPHAKPVAQSVGKHALRR